MLSSAKNEAIANRHAQAGMAPDCARRETWIAMFSRLFLADAATGVITEAKTLLEIATFILANRPAAKNILEIEQNQDD